MNPSTKAPDYLNIKQAASLLNVSEATLRRWTNSGQLVCSRVGKRRERRFQRSVLMALLATPEPNANKNFHGDASMPSQHTIVGGAPIPFGTHLCSLYSSDYGRTKLTMGFLADGLNHNCACYLVAAPSSTKELLIQLKIHRPSVEDDIANGSLVLLQSKKSGDDQLEFLEASFGKSLLQGYKCIRVVGNVSEMGIPISEVTKYEEDYERLLAQRFPLVTLCQYDVCKHSGKDVLEILKRHPHNFRFPGGRLLF